MTIYIKFGGEPLTGEDAIAAVVGPRGYNSTKADVAGLKAESVSIGSIILNDPARTPGVFVVRPYADFVAEVAADPTEQNYIRSGYDDDYVWVRASITNSAAAGIGSSTGASVETRVQAVEAANIQKTRERVGIWEIPGNKSVDEDPDFDASGHIQEWLADADTLQWGGRLAVMDGKTYRAKPVIVPIEKAISISGVPGKSKIIGLNPATEAEYRNSIVRFDGGENRPRGYVDGIDLDARGRIFLPAAASGSGFNFRNFSHVDVSRCYGDSGNTYAQTPDVDGKIYGADSLFVFTMCDSATVRSSGGRGWKDKLAYLSGSDSADPATARGLLTMIDCYAEFCNTFASATRQLESLQIIGGWARDCANGLGTTHTGDGIPGGLGLSVSNFWQFRVGRPYRLWGGVMRTIIKGGGIEDFGLDPLTLLPLQEDARQVAVSCRGLRNADIDLHISMRRWLEHVTENYAAYDLRSYSSFPSDGRNCYGNKIRGFVVNLPRGYAVYENAGTGPNDIELNVDNVGSARADSSLISYSNGTTGSLITHKKSDGTIVRQRNNKLLKGSWTPRFVAIGDTGFDFGVSKGPFTASVTGGTTMIVTNSGGHDFLVGNTVNHASALMSTTIAEQLTSTEPDGALHRRGTYRLNKVQPDIASSGSWKLIDTSVASTSECNFQLTEDEVIEHGRVIIPFVFRAKGTIVASVSGKALTVPDAAGVLLGASRGTVTGSVVGDLWTVNEAPSASIVVGDWPKQANILAGTTVLSQISSSEIDGALGKAGVYRLSQAQPTIATTTFIVVNTAALMGLRNDALLTGTYIVKQLTGVAGGAGTYELNQAPLANITNGSFVVLGSGDIRFYDLPWPAATGGGDGEGQTGIDGGVLFPADALDICANIPAGQAYGRFRWKGNARRFLRTIDLDLPSLTLRMQWTVTYRKDELQ
jgi:hypothetical protein